MFNFVAAALMVYLLVNVLIAPGSMTPQSRDFGPSGLSCRQMAGSALNLSLVLALVCCVAVWVFLWRTPMGLRAAHHGPQSRGRGLCRHRPAPHDHARDVPVSGGLAGFVGVNEVMGVHHRIVLDFPAGYGFVGIAVALMGRNHPVGIVARGAAVRRPAAGRRRARLRDPQASPARWWW